MKKKLLRLKDKKGSAHIGAVIGFFILMIALALFMALSPVFMAKANLDYYANELVREAEISGYVGSSTTGKRLQRLNQIKGLNPTVKWSRYGKVNIGEEVTVTVSTTVVVNLFGQWNFELQSSATGKSEVFYK